MEEHQRVALPALGVVVIARVVGDAADAACVRPPLVSLARADAPDLADCVLEGVAEAVGGASPGEVSVRDRGRVGVKRVSSQETPRATGRSHETQTHTS